MRRFLILVVQKIPCMDVHGMNIFSSTDGDVQTTSTEHVQHEGSPYVGSLGYVVSAALNHKARNHNDIRFWDIKNISNHVFEHWIWFPKVLSQNQPLLQTLQRFRCRPKAHLPGYPSIPREVLEDICGKAVDGIYRQETAWGIEATEWWMKVVFVCFFQHVGWHGTLLGN